MVDALIPIGRGQRELILGDRQTGKTAIAVDVIANQRNKGAICIYCAIGQRSASVARVISALEEKQALDYTVLVVAEPNEAPGLLYIAPYTATVIAEFSPIAGSTLSSFTTTLLATLARTFPIALTAPAAGA